VLVVAVEVDPGADAKDAAVSLVEPDPVRHLGDGPFPALNPAVDDVSDHAIPGITAYNDGGRALFTEESLPRSKLVGFGQTE
jgi:hypothetical protein